MTTDTIRRHCREIDRCNQRGGRMLSIVDLIDAGTISRDLAAYVLAAIGDGASFMVGANPGGAGKTTVMGALLNFVPDDVELVPADGMAAIQSASAVPGRRCYICHEIGSGPYYAYLWGEELRAYFELAGAGHMLATNLHADTYDQAYHQVVVQNGVSDEAFWRMNLLFFLHLRGRERTIASVWESDGQSPHREILTAGAVIPSADSADPINKLIESDARTIEEVRSRILDLRRNE
jgi:hypothetical protein